jgi:hypothetical protein
MVKKYIKTITLSLSLIILSTLAFVGGANAESIRTGDITTVAAGETVDGMIFMGGNNINIAGEINGAGQSITISGTVKGDVICAGRDIMINGVIEGNIRLAGQNIILSGTVGNSATIAAQNLNITDGSIVSRDLLGGSQSIIIGGQIGRDVVAGSQDLTINGNVGRNIDGDTNTLTVGSTGRIGGNVNYTGTYDPNILSGGTIVGSVNRTAPQTETKTASYSPIALAFSGFIYVFISMMIVALIVASLFPRTLNNAFTTTTKAPVHTILVGIAAAILIPVSIVMLLMTFVGAPLAIMAVLAWILITILTGPFVGYSIGHSILRTDEYPVRVMLLGGSILMVFSFIPIIGFVTIFATYILGMGMILYQIKKLLFKAN